MTGTADVIVIGGGLISAATAFELAGAGRNVPVLDRNAGAGPRVVCHCADAMFDFRRHRLRVGGMPFLP
ncbi:FAD-dependent oxidoreductase [Chachezhania antarctica]|uniref:FAD-dependent oxidoreductase n=1 Tax=Chachezhania antarctica TaxID=2340860 RepID=UPI000EB35DF6|nr:FAD-dependent oxidoreductase [Chachezhania antarctica]